MIELFPSQSHGLEICPSGERSRLKKGICWVFSGPSQQRLIASVQGLIPQQSAKPVPASECPCCFPSISCGLGLCTLWSFWVSWRRRKAAFPVHWAGSRTVRLSSLDTGASQEEPRYWEQRPVQDPLQAQGAVALSGRWHASGKVSGTPWLGVLTLLLPGCVPWADTLLSEPLVISPED